MKIATWNIPYAFRRASHSDAWEHYLERISADYYLAQEVRPPDRVRGENAVVWANVEGQDWGSGVVSRRHGLHEVEVDTEFRGAFVVAESETPGGVEITLVSVYGLFENIGGHLYSTPNLHRMLSDLTGLLDGRIRGKRNVVLGGDLNASVQFDEVYGGDNSRIFFERLKSFGLTNCFDAFYDDYVQTLRHNSSNRDWQNDYLFVSDALADRVESCEVLEDEMIRAYSDHNPVVITLDVI